MRTLARAEGFARSSTLSHHGTVGARNVSRPEVGHRSPGAHADTEADMEAVLAVETVAAAEGVAVVAGALVLLVPIAFLGWLLYLTWPHLRRPERMMRVSVLLLVVAIAVTALVPR